MLYLVVTSKVVIDLKERSKMQRFCPTQRGKKGEFSDFYHVTGR
jgi:hypothetical protein